MSTIFVITRNLDFFNHLGAVLAGAEHTLIRRDNIDKLTGGWPNRVAIVDVDVSPYWADEVRHLTEAHELKVIVVSAHPTVQEAADALAYLRRGTALAYLALDVPGGELRKTIRLALTYQPLHR